MKLITHLIIGMLAVYIASAVIPGVKIDTWVTALIVAVVLGVLNVFLKPILIVLTLPITILTLGLFTFVINTLLVLLADALIAGFSVSGFWQALLFSFVFFILNSAMYRWAREDR